MIFLLALLLAALTAIAQPLAPVIAPRGQAMAGALVAAPGDPSSLLFNPAGLASLEGMGSDMSLGNTTGDGTDRLLAAFANSSSEEGSRMGTGVYVDGQTRPGATKYVVPYVAIMYQPMSRLAVGATVRMIRSYPRADSLDGKWSNAIDIGMLTPGKNLNFGARIERAFGGASVVPQTFQWGIAARSDNRRMTLSYQWDGALLKDVAYRYEASRFGAQYAAGKLISVSGGYIWSDIHRITFGGAFGQIEGGSLIQIGWSLPTEGKAPTEWSVGYSYRM
ncbi:MAG: hypothetical protein IPH10_07600 [bacterium]|nr:hypothetical protein [bacterium]